jgi:hypothetical protein
MPIKLEIGSGRKSFEDYITIDNDPSVEANLHLDIEEETIYSKDDLTKLRGQVDEIRAYHVLEHIRSENKVKVMWTFFELLRPGGILRIEVPCFPCPASVQDPTHVSFWNPESFWYFIKGNNFGEGFKNRYSKYPVCLYEFVKDNQAELVSKGWNEYIAYNIILKKPL